jgi:glycine/D-amino acid oxidase-like deaminating enzyme
MKSKAHGNDGVVSSGTTVSYWLDSAKQPMGIGKLDKNITTDVVIVGGGLAGLSVAYSLCDAGKKVVVIEDGWIGSGETGRTTAQLVTALDDRYYKLEKIFGEEDTRMIAASHQAAIRHVAQIIHKEKIDCQFLRLPGYLFRHPTDDTDALERELAAAQRAGVEVRMIDHVPGMTDGVGACLEFADQAQFHPLLYLEGLCKAIEAKGGEIYTETHADKINHEGITTSEGFTVKANHVVVATNSPVNNLVAMHLKQSAYRTYVIAGLIKKDKIKSALWWDTGDHDVDADIPPYHYVRLQP